MYKYYQILGLSQPQFIEPYHTPNAPALDYQVVQLREGSSGDKKIEGRKIPEFL